MRTKVIAVFLIAVLVMCFLAGCEKNEVKPDTTVTDKPVVIPPDEVTGKPVTIPGPGIDMSSFIQNEGGKNSDEPDSPTLTETPEVTEEPTATEAPSQAPENTLEKLEAVKKKLIDNADYYDSLDNSSDGTWCFQRKKDHSPSGTYEYFKITDYNGFYLDQNVTDDDKVIYLTFDCGYPSDLTVKILDTLKKHNAKASFFVTKMYLEECADYAKRMIEEGHAVCNHTVSHTDLTNKSVEKIAAEIIDVAEYFYEVTGYEFAPYFRTPTGAYTKRLMTIIKDAGYSTVFWSIAYGDYDPKNQPEPGYVLNHFETYHHNGAVALMHNDSPSNANELDAVLTMLEKEGYRFGALSEIKINT